MKPRHYLALTALAAALALAACTTPTGKATPGAASEDTSGSGEPDLLQKLRERMAHGGRAKPHDKPAETATSAAADTSKAPSEAAAAASAMAMDPAKQQEAVAVAADYAQALDLMHGGEDDRAMVMFQRIAAKAPDFSGPLVNQGLILLKQQKYADAEAIFKQAVGVNPHSAFAFNMLGIALREQGKFAEAKACYEMALSIDPNYARAHFNLGVLADLYLQDFPLAIAQYQAYQALQAKPDKAVGNWIVDLQKRSGTYKAPAPKPQSSTVSDAPDDSGAISGNPAAAAGSGTPAATAGSAAPTAAATSATSSDTAPAASAGSANPAPTASSGSAAASAGSGANPTTSGGASS